MKITNLELFQNTLKIILVGTGIFLSPHKYFQFERTLKNVVMNSESAFWDIFLESHLLGLLLNPSRRAWGGHESTSWGAPKGVAGQAWWSSLELHMASHFALNTLMCDLMHGSFW
jgi:hypothetical protein